MRKKVKNALIVGVAGLCAAGLVFTSACSDYYKSDALEGNYDYTEVISNGGFAVQAGDYVYFINGVEDNDADNSYGDVQKGSLVRISLDDLAEGNYSNVDTVVPLVMYSDTYDAGIYIYGDYVYYCTPSTSRDSDGEVQSDLLEFKRTKLDGTETMKSYYYQGTPDDYRIVEVDGTVYLIYAASSETLYDEDTGVTNIHSVNFTTGEDTVLAYNVSDYIFDTEDATNPYVYYTMAVTYNLGTGYEWTANYNQLYRVCADATEDTAPNSYDFSYVSKYDEDFDEEETPLYINLGELVFDGINYYSIYKTQFNYGYDSSVGFNPVDQEAVKTITGFVYSLSSYENGVLYYGRENYDSNNSDLAASVILYLTDAQYENLDYVTDDADAEEGTWNAITQNPTADEDTEGTGYDGKEILYGDDISSYTIIPDNYDDPTTFNVIYTEANAAGYAIMYGELSGGVLLKSSFPMTTVSADITIYTFSEETVQLSDGTTQEYTFMYYGVSGEGNNYSVHRVAIGGEYDDYVKYPTDGQDTSNYQDQRICDLDVYTSWYMPEVLAGQLFFASDTDDMADYYYIMAFDLRARSSDEESTSTSSGEIITMSNAEIEELTDLYNEIIDGDDSIIADIDEDNYENLPNALYYAFYTRDIDYIDELIQLWVDEGEDEEYLFSTQSVQKYKDFINAEGDYAEYAEYSRTINGDDVYATSRDYYYSLVGYMSDDDAEDYIEGLRSSYMPSEPEEGTWFEELETWAKVLFITGVSLAGLIVIAAAVLIPIFVIRKRRKNLPAYRRRRMRVDTTDDKSIDVYGDSDFGDGAPTEGPDGADGE